MPRGKKEEVVKKRPYNRKKFVVPDIIQLGKHVDPELDHLRVIVNALEKMDSSAQLRTFNYLKSKYSQSFPPSSDY